MTAPTLPHPPPPLHPALLFEYFRQGKCSSSMIVFAHKCVCGVALHLHAAQIFIGVSPTRFKCVGATGRCRQAQKPPHPIREGRRASWRPGLLQKTDRETVRQTDCCCRCHRCSGLTAEKISVSCTISPRPTGRASRLSGAVWRPCSASCCQPTSVGLGTKLQREKLLAF